MKPQGRCGHRQVDRDNAGAGGRDIAGVSSGTVHYYFTDFAGLLAEVHQRVSERFFRDRMMVVTELADARLKMSAMIGTGIPWSSDDALVTALYRLDSYLASHENHSAGHWSLRQAGDAIWWLSKMPMDCISSQVTGRCLRDVQPT